MGFLLDHLHYIGFIGAALSLLGSFSRTMIPLRTMNASSNLIALIYASVVGAWPVLVQNAIQFPLNLYRLMQMRRLIRDIRAARSTDLHADWLVPFAHAEKRTAYSIIFRKGDRGDRLYYIASGRIRFQEIDIEIGEGSLFGELAFFTKDGCRTQTAECATDCELLSIGEDELKQLYFQNPEFGWYLVQLIVQRLQDNVERKTLPAK